MYIVAAYSVATLTFAFMWVGQWQRQRELAEQMRALSGLRRERCGGE